MFFYARKFDFFPKDFYLGALRLFLRVQAAASASPLIFRRRLGYVRWISISRDPRGAQDFDWVALPCNVYLCRNSLAATRPRLDSIYTEMAARRRFDFIYTEIAARRRFEFYLHRDWCAVEIWFWLICIYTVSGGDATKNGDFPIRKQRLQGSIFYYHYIIIKLF